MVKHSYCSPSAPPHWYSTFNLTPLKLKGTVQPATAHSIHLPKSHQLLLAPQRLSYTAHPGNIRMSLSQCRSLYSHWYPLSSLHRRYGSLQHKKCRHRLSCIASWVVNHAGAVAEDGVGIPIDEPSVWVDFGQKGVRRCWSRWWRVEHVLQPVDWYAEPSID